MFSLTPILAIKLIIRLQDQHVPKAEMLSENEKQRKHIGRLQEFDNSVTQSIQNICRNGFSVW